MNGVWFWVKNILSLLAGKLSLGKKVCAFEWCLVLSQKYTKSFGGKNLAMCNGFSHHKSKCMFDFWLDSVQKCRIFFFLATLPSQKIVKEIAYTPTSFQALFKSAIFLFTCLFNKVRKTNIKRQLKLWILYWLLCFIYNTQTQALIIQHFQIARSR